MKRIFFGWSLFFLLALTLLTGCGADSSSDSTAPLSADNLNLIFVVSPDLAYQTPGDINPDTANGSWIGFAGPHAMACGVIPLMLKSIPVLGYLAGGPTMVLLCGAYSWALGNTFIQHFESGGTFLNFDSDKVKEYFQAQFEEGKKVAATMKTKGTGAVQA